MTQFHAKTQAEVAAFFDRSPETIAEWARKGMPGSPGSYDLGAISRWLFSIGPWKSERAKGDMLDRVIEGDAILGDGRP